MPEGDFSNANENTPDQKNEVESVNETVLVPDDDLSLFECLAD